MVYFIMYLSVHNFKSIGFDIFYIFIGDCKKGLSAVRAVAAKYRMTNKPAPEVPSPYVDTILLPFRYKSICTYVYIYMYKYIHMLFLCIRLFKHKYFC